MNDAISNADSTKAYVLGHSGKEIERLQMQARLVGPITKQIFHDAGIAPGMRRGSPCFCASGEARGALTDGGGRSSNCTGHRRCQVSRHGATPVVVSGAGAHARTDPIPT
jgi:hypothetical protein